MAVPGNWTLFYDWNCSGNYGSTTMNLNTNGTWSSGQGYSGQWIQVAGLLIFKFNNSNTTYAGNLADRSVTGIQSTFGGLNGCFYMLQAGVLTAFAEERGKHKADSSGKE
jgi:hypothetical protein